MNCFDFSTGRMRMQVSPFCSVVIFRSPPISNCGWTVFVVERGSDTVAAAAVVPRRVAAGCVRLGLELRLGPAAYPPPIPIE